MSLKTHTIVETIKCSVEFPVGRDDRERSQAAGEIKSSAGCTHQCSCLMLLTALCSYELSSVQLQEGKWRKISVLIFQHFCKLKISTALS